MKKIISIIFITVILNSCESVSNFFGGEDIDKDRIQGDRISILSLEKNLSSDKQKILSYFAILEKLNLSDETEDIISFKKALYLIKSGDLINGNELLKKLIDKNSNLKSIAEELYKN